MHYALNYYKSVSGIIKEISNLKFKCSQIPTLISLFTRSTLYSNFNIICIFYEILKLFDLKKYIHKN